MTREEMIHRPKSIGSVRMVCPVDVESLLSSLSSYIAQAQEGKTQQGLRWAGDFEGTGDIQRQENNPRKLYPKDFVDWQPDTEILQNIANSLGMGDCGRVRMLMMLPKTTYTLHYDADLWRLHIPLITNPDAFMFVDGKMWHLPIGNAYLVKVEHHHLAVNAGLEKRIHLVFDAAWSLAA